MTNNSEQIENLNLQLLASYLFLISNIASIDATIALKKQYETNIENTSIKKTAKFAVSLQLIGIIIFLIVSFDDYQTLPTKYNKAFLDANVLSTISNIIRFQTLFNPNSSFEGSEDIS